MSAPIDLCPPGPEAVPSDLAAPTALYRRHAWLALGGIVLFASLYLGLTAFLGWTAFRSIRDGIESGDVVRGVVFGIPSALFFAFLARGLVFRSRRDRGGLVEVTAQDQPDLLAFIDRVADETGAPRPARVFLSAQVNAAVFYDVSLATLLWPAKKNLEIGLGLVNALSLDELKAVVAHEFGHFAQRTTAVGRWVYVAQRITGELVASRGWLDRVADFFAYADIRIMWIGWILRLLVWSIRAVLDSLFVLVVLAHRALSREMELQADLVATSVSGSDSLTHALYRLGPADEAWHRAFAMAIGETAAKRTPADLFALQSAILEHLRAIHDDPSLGCSPSRPKEGADAHRIFAPALAMPPRMWSTHPPNHEREENAKRRYFPSVLDERSAWLLFRDPDAVRRTVTGDFLAVAFSGERAPPVDTAQTLERLEREYARAPLQRRYRGTYLHRDLASSAAAVDALYTEDAAEVDRDALLSELGALYPESLADDVVAWRALRSEVALLEGLQDGALTAPGGVIRHRGREIARGQLAAVVAEVRHEAEVARDRVIAHDRRCRSAHRRAARLLGGGWEEYLVGLAALVHYAEHAVRDVRDAHAAMHHVLQIAVAEGRVGWTTRTRLAAAGRELWTALHRVYTSRREVVLPQPIALALESETWAEVLGEDLKLLRPTTESLGDFLAVADSWADAASGALSALLESSLDELLAAEATVARVLAERAQPDPPPKTARVPSEYPVLLEGRERQRTLDRWTRFQLADGLIPGLARFAAAAMVLLPALAFAGGVGGVEVHVYNGLATEVEVSIDGDVRRLAPGAREVLELGEPGVRSVVTRTTDGREIERFEAEATRRGATYVYNVAGATTLVEWTVVHGDDRPPPPERPLGNLRWFRTQAAHVLVDPPRSIPIRRGERASQRVVTGLHDRSPLEQLAYLPNSSLHAVVARRHLRWDDTTDPRLFEWFAVLNGDPQRAAIVAERVASDPGSPLLAMFETADPSARERVCARLRLLAERHPAQSSHGDLALRCIEDASERAAQIERRLARAPRDPWLRCAKASTLADQARWSEAAALLEEVYRDPALRGLTAPNVILLARLRRMLGNERIDDLARYWPPIDSLSDPDRFLTDDPQTAPWFHLAHGDLQRALEDASPIGVRARMLRHLAASEGVREEIANEARSLPSEAGLDPDTVWFTLALARREGHDPAPYVAFAQQHFTRNVVDTMLRAVDAADPATLNATLEGLTPELRGHALVIGVVMFGDAAPAQWRREARRLLFAFERPYFAAAESALR